MHSPARYGRVFALIVACLSLAIAVLSALPRPGGPGSAAAAPAAPLQGGAVVTIGDNFFDPAEVTIRAGETITWIHNGIVPHTTTSKDEPPVWDSGTMTPGDVFTHTFPSAGTYDYECIFHALLMRGTVIVEPEDGTATATGMATQTATATGTGTQAPTATPTGAATGTHPTPTATGTEPPTATATDVPTVTVTTSATPTAGTPDPTPTPVPDGPEIGLVPVLEGLTAPVALRQPDDGSGRLFVVDQIGLIRIVDAGGQLLPEPFLDLRDRMVELRESFDERGLLGLAFHPEYAANGRLFVYYSAPLRDGGPEGWNHTSHVSAFQVSDDDPDRAAVDSEEVLLQVDQPQFNHDGGTIAFGPDGYLYVPLGDGGGANDTGMGHGPDGNGQDPSTLLGSILRLDVNAGGQTPYAIPADNPFLGDDDVRDEIFAYGFRNPFRIAFDRQTGDLYAGDVGQDLYEEVDVVLSGRNYGWNIREGTHCFDPDNPSMPPASCPSVGPHGRALVDPVIEYQNANAPGGLGYSVIGGVVYRGSDVPELFGRYVFGDWNSPLAGDEGLLLVATPGDTSGGTQWPFQRLRIAGDGLGGNLMAFGEDQAGEVYVLTNENAGPRGSTGRVWRIDAAEAPPGEQWSFLPWAER